MSLENAIFHDVFAYVSVDDNGKFETGYKLPPGRYRVSVEEQGDRVKVPEIYRSIATSELIVDLDQKGSPLSVMFQTPLETCE